MGGNDHNRCIDDMSAALVKQDCRYMGAVPWMERYVSTANLKCQHQLAPCMYSYFPLFRLINTAKTHIDTHTHTHTHTHMLTYNALVFVHRQLCLNKLYIYLLTYRTHELQCKTETCGAVHLQTRLWMRGVNWTHLCESV